ncbi:MAG TPA: hypothetical protein VKL21_06715 [Candidatus Methanoperedens sp.]|nr:hypothetical protein [Candidatus Methanoperedens sp.]
MTDGKKKLAKPASVNILECGFIPRMAFKKPKFFSSLYNYSTIFHVWIGKNVITKGVDKPGTVGECLIKFELE